jgi:hypothetical protein
MKITIEIDDQHKLERLMEWLRENKFLDEITVKSENLDYKPTITKGDKSIDPRALEGIWKDNPRPVEEIRRDAWGDRL